MVLGFLVVVVGFLVVVVGFLVVVVGFLVVVVVGPETILRILNLKSNH